MTKTLRLICKKSERKDATGKPYDDYYLVKGDKRCRVRFVFRHELATFHSFLSEE